MKLKFNKDELSLLKTWALKSTQGGHWGDGNLIMGEETSVLQKMEISKTGTLDFNALELRIIYFWMEENQNNKKAIDSPVSKSLENKIREAFHES